ncbi:hypothetical protein F4553_001585 [Allocatelliglobosispora scoriae]|uniref:Uncharacterized protein n=1 Tax=Allocatelliglobosispora scoriae TaxID=643052 RepID=A0A841BLS8_9ACTN|nr:hypothetical protein [Allocatelliglobosispora scoriae]MBB5868206.1 hypothetical protein [Allocatelliglobosispora scoriae]
MSPRRLAILAAATAGLMVLAIPGVAAASVPLSNDSTTYSTTPQSYTYSTTNTYWSVVALQSPTTGDFDLALSGNGVALGTSTQGTGRTDFIAVNSNSGYRPIGRYLATVTNYSGSGTYTIERSTGTNTIVLPAITHPGSSGASDPDLAFAVLADHDIVSIADMWLTAGQAFWATTPTAGQHLYLIKSTAGTPSTYVRNRVAAASGQSVAVIDGCTKYTPTVTGWHALVLVDDREPELPQTPPDGIAHALKLVDPATPNTCPVKNFPAATP